MDQVSVWFRRFLESVDGAERLHADDLDLAALARLAGDARATAEALLLKRLAEDASDGRAAGALAIVGSPSSFLPLRAALGRAIPSTRVRIAATLAKLDPAFDAVPTMLELLGSNDVSARASAAGELESAPKAQAQLPLLHALGDPHFGVRASAFGALLHLHALTHLRQHPRSRLRAISTRLLSDLDTVVAPAAAEIRALVAELDAGRTPDDLDLAALPAHDQDADLDRVIASLDEDAEGSLDLDALRRLKGHARRLLECLALGELHTGNPRMIQALDALGSEDAIEPLRELLAKGIAATAGDAAHAAASIALEHLLASDSGAAR